MFMVAMNMRTSADEVLMARLRMTLDSNVGMDLSFRPVPGFSTSLYYIILWDHMHALCNLNDTR